jgi:rhomboid protease GluP
MTNDFIDNSGSTPVEKVFALSFGQLRRREARSALLYGVIGLTLALQTDWASTEDGGLWVRLMGLVLVYLGYRFTRAGVRTHSVTHERVELREDGLFLPAILVGVRGRLVPWATLKLAAVFQNSGGGVIVLADHRDSYRIDSIDVGSWARMETLVKGIYAYTMRDPDQKAAMIEEARQFQLGQVRLAIRPIVTQALLVVIGLIYLLEIYLDAVAWDSILSADILMLARMGANTQFLVQAGEFDRWCTAAFLHVGWLHIASNAFGLFCVGMLAELTLGRVRLLLVYFGSAVVASAASTYLAAGLVSAGASGAIFGVLGACFYVQIFATELMPYTLRIRGRAIRAWAVVFLLNIAIPIALPMVDYVAHLAGFVAGFLIAGGCGRRNIGQRQSPGFLVQAMVMILLGTFLATGALRAHAFSDDEDLGIRLLGSITPDTPAKRDLLNGWAWSIVANGAADDREMRGAAVAMRRVNSFQSRADYLDTEASLQHRLGDAAAAVRLERQAWQSSHESGIAAALRDGFWASQLLYFLSAAPPSVKSLSVTRKGSELLIRGSGLSEPDTEVYVGVYASRTPLGIVRAVLPGTAQAEHATGLIAGLPTDTIRLRVLGQFKRLKLTGIQSVRYWPLDEGVTQIWDRMVIHKD